MIYTFYSYKGGVGRSMALAAVAYVFARRGLRVLAIDFDMEAPGLERYFFDGERSRSVRAQRGLMDLIKAYRLALSNESAFQQAEFKQLDRFRLTAIGNAAPPRGAVDLMTAGQREPEDKLRSYALDVRGFDWQDFFQNWKGNLFFDWLRRQLTDGDTGYDVVLVDSRTGVTEMGGVCAYQLADVAVLLCAPNYQNLEGTRDVARDFRSDAVLGLRQGRPLEILAVPARLEENHPSRGEFLDAFRRELQVDGLPKVLAEEGLTYESLALPYLPQFAVVERLVGERDTDTNIESAPVAAFERLAAALCLLAPEDSALGRQQGWARALLRGEAASPGAKLQVDPTLSSAGFDAYLDVAPADEAMGRELASALEAAGLRVFVGTSRPDDVALEYSHALVTCFGAPSEDENRAHLLARARKLCRVRIVPVVLPGGSPGALASFDLGTSQAIVLRDWPDEPALDALLAALRTPAVATAEPTAFRAERDPYPGDAPYREDDAEFFAGREAQVQQVVAALAADDVVVVRGPAQVGKTSLLAAGVLPALRSTTAPTHLRGRKLHWLDARDLPEAPPDDDAPAVVVIDHVDSFDADGRPEAVGERIARLHDWLRSAGEDCKFLLCCRDVLPEEGTVLWDPVRCTTIEVQPLADEALRRAIEEPARRCGHLLEPGLAERLVEGTRPADNAIRHIQRALAALWPDRRRGWLTNKCLDALGQVAGMFERHLAQVRDSLVPDWREAADVLFKHLVLVNAQVRIVPAPQDWEVLAQVPAIARIDALALRDRLASAGLIDLRREATDDGDRVRVALAWHDAAVYLGGEDLPDLRFLMWRSELATDLQRWRGAPASPEALLRGSALEEAKEWRDARGDHLAPLEIALIEASVRHEEARRDARQRADEERLRAAEERALQEQRVSARLRRGRFVLGVATLFAVGMAGVAWSQKETAERKSAQAALKADAVASLTASTRASVEQLQSTVAELASTNYGAGAGSAQAAIDQLQGVTEQLQRASGELAPRVYIHIAQESQRRAALAFARQLGALEYDGTPIIVPGVQLTKHAARGVLRCFRARECAAEAPGLVDLANGLLDAPKLQAQDLSKQYENSAGIRAHHFEIWFGPDEIRLAQGK